MRNQGTARIMAGIISLACIIVLAATVSEAQVPKKINYQGFLKNSAGNPVNGQVQMTFGLYAVASGGTALWSETRTVTVNAGNYSVDLGAINPINLTEAKPYWLGVKVGADPEMTPRKELTSAMYALFTLNTGGLWTQAGNSIYYNNGNVGIGTTTPERQLHIKNSENSIIRVESYPKDDTTPALATYELITREQGGGKHRWAMYSAAVGGGWGVPANSLTFWEYNDKGCDVGGMCAPRLVLQGNTGNVGIGTTNPTYKLSVNGTIRAKEIIVDTNWADFVFDKNYQLMPLSDVEQHIAAEKHLPGIPSAQEVAANGVSVGDMQAKQLQKIEELTLYVIQMNKQLTALQQENESLKAKVSTLEQAAGK